MTKPSKERKIRRQPVRRRRRQSAWIALESERKDRECEVVDVSPAGAKIVTGVVVEVGHKFGITLVPNAPKRTCQVVWCRGRTMGIKFVT